MNFEQNGSYDQKMLFLKYLLQSLYIFISTLDSKSIIGVVSLDAKLIILSIVQRINIPSSISPSMTRSCSEGSLSAGNVFYSVLYLVGANPKLFAPRSESFSVVPENQLIVFSQIECFHCSFQL